MHKNLSFSIFFRAPAPLGLSGGKRQRRAVEGFRRGDSARGPKCCGIGREADANRGDDRSNSSTAEADGGDDRSNSSTAEADGGDDRSEVVAHGGTAEAHGGDDRSELFAHGGKV